MKKYNVSIVIVDEKGSPKLLNFSTEDLQAARLLIAEFTDNDWTALIDIQADVLREHFYDNNLCTFALHVYKNSLYGVDKSEYCGALITHKEKPKNGKYFRDVIDFKEIVDAAECDFFGEICKEFKIK